MTVRAAVVDASIAAPWFLPDEASEASDRLYASVRRGTLVLHAPDLWLWECGNIVSSAVRRRRLAAEDARIALAAIDAIRPRLEIARAEPGDVSAAFEIAAEQRLSVYDAAYLGLAMATRLPLLTADRALVRAAAARGLATVAAGELA